MADRGRCFEDAFEIASQFVTEAEPYPIYVCHGVPVGQGAENYGLRYWHAWAERGVVCYVRDPRADMLERISRDNVLEVPRGLFYAVGGLRAPDHVRMHTLAEAMRLAAETGTYGPWVEIDARAAELEQLVQVF